MKPDSSLHNPDPHYIRSLISASGVSAREAARRIGVSERMMRYYIAAPGTDHHRPAPYLVQFALESLAGRKKNPKKQ